MRVARELIEFAQDYPHETPAPADAIWRKQAEMVLAAIYHDADASAWTPLVAAE